MLGKLLKYEFKSTSRVFLLLYPSVLLLALFSKISFQFLPEGRITSVVQIVLMTFFVISVIGVIIVSFVIILQRFYRNLLSNEGYLMWTLPVKASTHILSKLITALVWQISSIIVAALAILIVVPEYDWIKTFAQTYRNFEEQFNYYSEGSLALIIALVVITFFIALVYSYMNFFTALSLGNLANKNKIAFSVLAYFGLNMLFQGITVLSLGIFFNAGGLDLGLIEQDFPPAKYIYLILMICILLYTILTGILFFVSKYILKNKLNLQ